MASTGIKIVNYTPKSFVIIGDTVSHKLKLKELGGMYKPSWKCGAGWMFPVSKKDVIKEVFNEYITDEINIENLDTSTNNIPQTSLVENLKKEVERLNKELSNTIKRVELLEQQFKKQPQNPDLDLSTLEVIIESDDEKPLRRLLK